MFSHTHTHTHTQLYFWQKLWKLNEFAQTFGGFLSAGKCFGNGHHLHTSIQATATLQPARGTFMPFFTNLGTAVTSESDEMLRWEIYDGRQSNKSPILLMPHLVRSDKLNVAMASVRSCQLLIMLPHGRLEPELTEARS